MIYISEIAMFVKMGIYIYVCVCVYIMYMYMYIFITRNTRILFHKDHL